MDERAAEAIPELTKPADLEATNDAKARKNYEQRMRARAQRQGFKLRRSPGRVPSVAEHATYMLVQGYRNRIVSPVALSLDEI